MVWVPWTAEQHQRWTTWTLGSEHITVSSLAFAFHLLRLFLLSVQIPGTDGATTPATDFILDSGHFVILYYTIVAHSKRSIIFSHRRFGHFAFTNNVNFHHCIKGDKSTGTKGTGKLISGSSFF